MMRLREWLAANLVLVLIVLAGLATLGFITQTIRLDGLQLRAPIIGTIGPKGWKPYARELEGKVAKIRIWLDRANANHKATKTAFRAAQAEAARIQAEVIAAEIDRQERINHHVRQNYERRLAALRARAERLQRDAKAGTGAAGAAGPVPVPASAPPARAAAGAPDCRRLPPPDFVTDIYCREIATRQAEQLNALIDWFERQRGPVE